MSVFTSRSVSLSSMAVWMTNSAAFTKRWLSLSLGVFSTALIVSVVARPSDESLESLHAVVAKVK